MKPRAAALITLFLVSLITGCAKVSLINKEKSKRGLSAQNSSGQITAQATAGFAIVSGGGFAKGEGLSVRATIGESTGQALQSGGSLNLWSGVQSTISN